jgi:hypothetical protein
VRATLYNLSPFPRNAWATTTFPAPLAERFGPEATFRVDDDQEWRAVRGRTIGMKTVYRIQNWMGGSEALTGTIIPKVHHRASDFILHPWVSDDINALLPGIGSLVNGQVRKNEGLTALRLVDHSPAHQRWWVKVRIPEEGLLGEFWMDLLHGDCAIPLVGKVVWSDRKDRNPNKAFELLSVQAGEMLELDFRDAHGIQPPLRVDGQWITVLNDRPIVLNDGAGLPLSGHMLAFVSPKAEEDPGPAVGDWMEESVRNLMAARFGPVVGVSHDWEGSWLAHGNVPRLDRVPSPRDFDEEWDRFQQKLQVRAGWFAPRPIGCTQTPGQTGDQEDFGATKGTRMVTCLDPRWLRQAQYAVQAELFRGFNHYEETGQPLNLMLHPKWTTWNGGTHFRESVSPDSLNKDRTLAPPGTGWYGYDDQHRSQNNLASYMMLTDDSLMDDQLRHLVTTDRASYRVKFPSYGSGAARAIGRTTGAWAHFLTVTEGETRDHFLKMMRLRLNVSRENPSLHVSGPMRMLAWGSPDGRKPIVDGEGKPGRWTSMWEHGLAAVGLYADLKQLGEGEREDAEFILRTICDSMARFAFFNDDDTWWTVDDMLWSDGAAPPGGLVAGSKHFTHHVGVQGVGNWTFAGLLVAAEVLGRTHPRAEELRGYIEAHTGGVEAGTQRDAEWWAAVKTVRGLLTS